MTSSNWLIPSAWRAESTIESTASRKIATRVWGPSEPCMGFSRGQWETGRRLLLGTLHSARDRQVGTRVIPSRRWRSGKTTPGAPRRHLNRSPATDRLAATDPISYVVFPSSFVRPSHWRLEKRHELRTSRARRDVSTAAHTTTPLVISLEDGRRRLHRNPAKPPGFHWTAKNRSELHVEARV